MYGQPYMQAQIQPNLYASISHAQPSMYEQILPHQQMALNSVMQGPAVTNLKHKVEKAKQNYEDIKHLAKHSVPVKVVCPYCSE